ncbi:unnamed protein product [Prorocentrum cordatum]|uniref:Uncharacterized protein n=1 Tax=Prorocentrum cordatum TaxID=2364126 RepID=A0ABN9QHF0_9DINO|nr:unnamed protein product [Polarella glacialis]
MPCEKLEKVGGEQQEEEEVREAETEKGGTAAAGAAGRGQQRAGSILTAACTGWCSPPLLRCGEAVMDKIRQIIHKQNYLVPPACGLGGGGGGRGGGLRRRRRRRRRNGGPPWHCLHLVHAQGKKVPP